MLTFTRESSSESQTHAIAGEVAKCLRPRDVIALDGALGAGKTCFVRGLVAGLGGDPRQVSSPTFVLHQEYEVGGFPSPLGRGAGGEGEHAAIALLAHIDAYRMGRGEGAQGQRGEGCAAPSDLESIGWDELLGADDFVIAIEWPTRIPQDALPRLRTIRIQFEVGRGEGAKGQRDEGGGALSPQDSSLKTHALTTVGRGEGAKGQRDEGGGALSPQDSSLKPQALPSSFRRLAFAIPTAIEERFSSLIRQARACRTCGREITADGSTELAEVNPFFPFCSERCKLADLGAWFSEKYKITGPIEQRDIEEG